MLKVDLQEKNLGEVKVNQSHKFTYTLTNDSESEVILNKLHAGCRSCTTLRINTSKLKPYESTEATVTYTPAIIGISEKSVTIGYEQDNKQTDLVLRFIAKVVR